MAALALLRPSLPPRVLIPEVLPPIRPRWRRLVVVPRTVRAPWRLEYGATPYETEEVGVLVDVYG